MMPGVHLLTLVSVLDDALEEHIVTQEILWPPKTKRDLFNRIKVVGSCRPGLNQTSLNEIREARNAVAHGVEIDGPKSITWKSLDIAIDVAMDTFSVLSLHDRAPKIEAYFQRHPTLYPDELGPSGERMRQSHRVGARIDDEILLEYGIEVSYLPPTDA